MAVPKIWRRIPESYNLIGTKCAECNSLYFPGRQICRKCGDENLRNYQFKGEGSIVTYTVIRTPVSDPEGENVEIVNRNMPYVLAIIKLNEGPLLTAEIIDSEFGKIEIGKKVEVVFRKILEKGKRGVIQYGYKFRLV